MRSVVDPAVYENIEIIIGDYEVRYNEAVKRSREAVAPQTKDDLMENWTILNCPECGTATLPCLGDEESECTLCGEQFKIYNLDLVSPARSQQNAF
jgi:hypothetical protein